MIQLYERYATNQRLYYQFNAEVDLPQISAYFIEARTDYCEVGLCLYPQSLA